MVSRRSFIALPLIAAVPVTRVFAADYPTRTVRMVIPLAAGSATDACARYFAGALAKEWGQPFLVENKVGAGGVIAADFVAKSPADGYTILFTYAAHYSNPWVEQTPYDAVRDFVPVARVASSALVFMVPVDSPFKSVADIVAAAKKNPGGLSYGTAGNGTSGHMCGALLSSMANVKLTHVPYKSSAQVAVDTAGGVLDFGINGTSTAMPLYRSGRLRILAVTSASRSSHFPDVPAVAESGLPGYEVMSPVWAMVPKGTPEPIVNALSTALTRAASSKDFAALAMNQGMEVDVVGADASRAAAPAEMEKWRQLVALTAANPIERRMR